MDNSQSTTSSLDIKKKEKLIIGRFTLGQVVTILIELVLPASGLVLIMIINPSYSSSLIMTRFGRFLLITSGLLTVQGAVLLFGLYGVVNYFFPIINGHPGKRLLVNAFITFLCIGLFSLSALAIIIFGPTLIYMAGIQ